MELHDLVIEIKLLERRMALYEEKYGISSRDFYNDLMAGKLSRFDELNETRTISAAGRDSTRPGRGARSPHSHPGLSFEQPNLPVILQEIEDLPPA
jgi:hypothetical protein